MGKSKLGKWRGESAKKLEELGQVRRSELNEFLKAMHQTSESIHKIVLNEWFSQLILNTIIRLMARKRYSYHREIGRASCRERV